LGSFGSGGWEQGAMGLRRRAWSSGFEAESLGYRVRGSGFGVWGIVGAALGWGVAGGGFGFSALRGSLGDQSGVVAR